MVIKNYRMIACDVENPTYFKEFTDVLKLHAWMNCDENKNRPMDFCTPQEHKWLLEQLKNKKDVKPKRKKYTME